MSQEQLYQWSEVIGKHLPSLKKWQALCLALSSLGVVLAERCTLSKVSEKLVMVGKADSIERRLQRWLSNGRLDIARLQSEWTRWVVNSLGVEEIMLLVDETKLGDHIGAMMVGLAYRGCCIPLAWRCYRANSSADYPGEGQVGMIAELLKRVAAGLPLDCQVLLEADRGIGTSPDLIQVVQSLDWGYLFRVQGQTRLKTFQGQEHALKSLVKPGESWQGFVWVFKKYGWLKAYVYLHWEMGYADPWCLVSNVPDLGHATYAMRFWQEAGFRDLKSDGWNWQRSRVWLPDHAERLILILALAYAWTLTQGTFVWDAPSAVQRLIYRGSGKTYSLFRQGLRYVAWLCHHELPIYLALLFLPDRSALKSVVT